MKVEKGLILIHREESTEDFREIARRMHKLDPRVGVAMVPEAVNSGMLPPQFLQLPLLVIYLVNPPPTRFKRATKLAVREMDKQEECAHFKKTGIAYPPLEPFHWDMQLDSTVYGERVVLKPVKITSTGKDVNVVPTHLIPTLTPAHFPAEHLIHQDAYYVQKFIKSEGRPTHYRALVLLDEILYSRRSISNIPYPDITDDVSALLRTSVASNVEDRVTDFVKDAEVNAYALRAAKTFTENPLFGFDIVREEGSGQLYVLEANLGGNVWHFSSNFAQQHRGGVSAKGRQALVMQYNAWDRAAEALLRKTHELAK